MRDRETRTEFINSLSQKTLNVDESKKISNWLSPLKRELAPSMLAAFDGGMLNDNFTDYFDTGPKSNREYTTRSALRDLGLVVQLRVPVQITENGDNLEWSVVDEPNQDSEIKSVNYLTPLGEEFVDAFASIPIRAPATIADIVSDFILGLPEQTRVSWSDFVPDVYTLARNAETNARENPSPVTYGTHRKSVTQHLDWATSSRMLTPWPPVDDISQFDTDEFSAFHEIIVDYSFIERYHAKADIKVEEEEYISFYQEVINQDQISLETVPNEERFPYLLGLFENADTGREQLAIHAMGKKNEDEYSVIIQGDEALFEWGEQLFESRDTVPAKNRL